jgi:hypothetical protein
MMSPGHEGSVARWRAIAWVVAAIVVLTFAAANAHLVYVATTSQPSCIPHARLGDASDGSFSAAQSACPSPGRADSQPMEKRP